MYSNNYSNRSIQITCCKALALLRIDIHRESNGLGAVQSAALYMHMCL